MSELMSFIIGRLWARVMEGGVTVQITLSLVPMLLVVIYHEPLYCIDAIIYAIRNICCINFQNFYHWSEVVGMIWLPIVVFQSFGTLWILLLTTCGHYASFRISPWSTRWSCVISIFWPWSVFGNVNFFLIFVLREALNVLWTWNNILILLFMLIKTFLVHLPSRVGFTFKSVKTPSPWAILIATAFVKI